MKFFHVTSQECADSILDVGFFCSPDEDYFQNYEDHNVLCEGLFKMLPPDVKDEVKSSENVDLLFSGWLKVYNGTILWVSKDSPDLTYGDVVLEVKIPEDAILICENLVLGIAYFINKPYIPSGYFKFKKNRRR